jgi:hypothetical protein
LTSHIVTGFQISAETIEQQFIASLDHSCVTVSTFDLAVLSVNTIPEFKLSMCLLYNGWSLGSTDHQSVSDEAVPAHHYIKGHRLGI